jgi:hypothetical protein
MKYRSSDQLAPEHIGRRVTVRRRLDEGGLGDVLGILEDVDEESVRVRIASGDVRSIARALIVAARVHPRPARGKPTA